MKLTHGNIICISWVLLALGINFMLLQPLLDDARAQKTTLQAQYNERLQQAQHPLTDEQLTISKKLENNEEEAVLLQALNTLRLNNDLTDVAYSLTPWQPSGNYESRKLDLTLLAPSDTDVLAFLNAINTDRVAKIDTLHIARSTGERKGVTASASLQIYGWP